MHPVIEHLNNRRNKAVPINDGRKIALVSFGGTMTGINGAGAMIALEELGLSYAFDEIYAISAGFCNVSCLLSKQTNMGTSIYYEDLCSKTFFNLFRFWNVVNIDFLIHVLNNIKKLDVKKILNSKTRLFVKL